MWHMEAHSSLKVTGRNSELSFIYFWGDGVFSFEDSEKNQCFVFFIFSFVRISFVSFEPFCNSSLRFKPKGILVQISNYMGITPEVKRFLLFGISNLQIRCSS